ncbi:MAG: hypothetical protein IT378_00475 [Sandaracinaceae bacterium]|nr:hypothetical protein [Sandaracinaceae bacterium]
MPLLPALLAVVAGGCVEPTTTAPPPPRIASLVPPRAEPGGIVTILGADFGPEPGRAIFAPDVGAAVLSWSGAEIIVTMPDAPDADAVRVETAEGWLSEWYPLPPVAPDPTLSMLQELVLTPSCTWSGCHGDYPAVGLSLVDGESHANLVGVPSSQLPSVVRVDPGSPGTSLLIDKLTHETPAVGRRMPLGLPPLSDDSVRLITAWIEAGAPND